MSSLRLALKLSIEDSKTPDSSDTKKITKNASAKTQKKRKTESVNSDSSKKTKSGEEDVSSDSEIEILKDSESELYHKTKLDQRKKSSPSNFHDQPPPELIRGVEMVEAPESSLNRLTPPICTIVSSHMKERKKYDRPKTPVAKTKQEISSPTADVDLLNPQYSEQIPQQSNLDVTSLSLNITTMEHSYPVEIELQQNESSPKLLSQESSVDKIQKSEQIDYPTIQSETQTNLALFKTEIDGEVDDEAVERIHQKDEKTSSSRKGIKRKKRGGLDLSESEVPPNSVIDPDKCDDLDEGAENIRGSSRAAAMAAKTKLNNNTIPKTKLQNESDLKKYDDNMTHIENIPSISSIILKAQWVACDRCGKWRSLPGDVDLSSLPEQWYCSMNKWDSLHADCAQEEEDYFEKDKEEEALLRSNRNDLSDVSSKRIKAGRGGRLGSRRGRKPNPKDSENMNIYSSPFIQGDHTDEEIGDNCMGTRRRRGGRPTYANSEIDYVESQAIYPLPPNTTLEKVHWVQCGKCSKWRKVPGKVHEEGLPDVWYCALNTWAPEFARCTAKEEEDDTISLAPMTGRFLVDGKGVGRGRYVRKTRLNDSSTPSAIRPWVQCERKNCKKWRKVPAHIDLSTLPEKWYCEMNIWDPERATCDASEETDSEGDTQLGAITRTQLILGNSKGPGTLSYRRLIFGTDGRIRPFYSEKNKNGSGLFSFTEIFRPNEGDEYVMPTRKISYWWSSVHQDSGSQYISSSKPDREKKVEPEKLQTSKVPDLPYNYQSVRPHMTQHLIDAIARLTPTSSTLVSRDCHPTPLTKWSKIAQEGKKQTLLSRINYCCEIVRSCLLVSSTETMTLQNVYRQVLSMYYINHNMETCRCSLSVEEIKETLYRLEQLGEIEVIYDNEGNLAFRLLMQIIENQNSTNPFPDLLSSSDLVMDGKSRPLKMRKRKFQFRPL